MNGGNELVASIGQLVLDFIVGLIKGILAPIISGIFGHPPAA